MRRAGIDGFVVPRADEHQSEYVPANAERLAWLTGFTGSAGTAVILADEAALVVDGRYTLQAPAQVDTTILTPVQLAETSLEAWIGRHLRQGFRTWLRSMASHRRGRRQIGEGGDQGWGPHHAGP